MLVKYSTAVYGLSEMPVVIKKMCAKESQYEKTQKDNKMNERNRWIVQRNHK